jgi:hypothetical protein
VESLSDMTDIIQMKDGGRKESLESWSGKGGRLPKPIMNTILNLFIKTSMLTILNLFIIIDVLRLMNTKIMDFIKTSMPRGIGVFHQSEIG